MFGLNLSEILQLCSSLGAMIMLVVVVFWGIKKPNVNQDQQIALIKQSMRALEKNVTLIQENHLAHIEKDISELKLNMREIITIINERMPRKPKN